MPNPPDTPPCVKIGEPMNWCARSVFTERVLGNILLVGDWKKWRFVGNYLVSPDGFKISAQRLQSLLCTQGRAVAAIAQKNAGRSDNVLRFDASRSRDLDKMPSESPG
jgi:Phage protein